MALAPVLALAAPVDVVVYGGTSAGVTAAVQAAQSGCTVVLIAPEGRLGGMSSAGLGQTDIGNKQAIGGLALRFYEEIARHYASDSAWRWQQRGEYKSRFGNAAAKSETSMWTFEPHVAEAVFERWIAAAQVPVVPGDALDRRSGVRRHERRIAALRLESGREIPGRIFIDASYEGDLLAGAGARYHVGRESAAEYGESLNGVQTAQARYHQFVAGVDPYRVKGDPTSGLLPGIDPNGPGEEGTGDRRVQAYNFRLCLTDHPENRIPFARPERYDERDYELLFRNFEAGFARLPWINSPMPNRKTDTNNSGGFSSDLIGGNYAYPEADYATRAGIVRRHREFQQGLMWTLANHPRVPESIRAEVGRWGLAKDEFVATGGWPPQLYIREARRLISEYVMTQANCQGTRVAPHSVGMAAYGIDSHHVQRHVDRHGQVRNEGDVQVRVPAPYPIDYRSIVPARGEVENLVVPVCLSATHIAYGSIRMEPVFMVLGQSAGIAADLALERNSALQELDYDELKARLLAAGQILAVSTAAAAPADPGLPVEQAVAALLKRGVLRHPGYWQDHARAGRVCSGGLVARVIMQAVKRIQHVDTLEQALEVLVARGASRHPEYWHEHARPGMTCNGASVARLLVGLAALEPAEGNP